MFRSGACFCILLLLIGAASAVLLNPSGVKVSAAATVVPKANQIPAHVAMVPCGEGTVSCNGKCSNINFDNANCGSCGMTCFDPAVCCNGQCVDLMYDEENCGSCGMTCFEPATCCRGSCKAACTEIALVMTTVRTTPSEVARIQTTPSEVAHIQTTPSEVAHIDTPTLIGVHGLVATYRNTIPATPVPQDCPSSGGWSCMQLAQAREQFGNLFEVHGDVPCRYINGNGQTVAEYCCRASEGLVPPSSLGAMGIKSMDTSLHIINRSPAAAGSSGQGKVYGKIVEQRADFVSTIFSLFTGLFAKPVSCGEGTVSCNGKCSDISFDNANCGSCGMTCFDPAVCCNGECVDLRTDGMNCGYCGMTCFDPAVCCSGRCDDPPCPSPIAAVTPEIGGMAVATPEVGGMAVVTPTP